MEAVVRWERKIFDRKENWQQKWEEISGKVRFRVDEQAVKTLVRQCHFPHLWVPRMCLSSSVNNVFENILKKKMSLVGNKIFWTARKVCPGIYQ